MKFVPCSVDFYSCTSLQMLNEYKYKKPNRWPVMSMSGTEIPPIFLSKRQFYELE